MSFEVIQLEDAIVVSNQYIGENPEIIALGQIFQWAEKNSLLGDVVHYFGFNNPDPTENSSEYGYEVWMIVKNGINESGSIKIKKLDGGLYAEYKGDNNIKGGEDILEAWVEIKRTLCQWLKENNYKYDISRRYLEEQTVSKKYLNNIFEEGSDYIMKILLPIKK